MEPLTFGSLFAGIGGIDLGFERAGMRCVWQVELDSFCRRVLERHWPHVRRHDDVRTFPPGDPADWRCDVIAGGFPCQDISYAGLGAGIDGDRSGLWGEFVRVVRVLRPRYVVLENVAALLGRGMDRVLGDLASLGFDAEWSVLSACAMGAPHSRERLFAVAYPSGVLGQAGLRLQPPRGQAAIPTRDHRAAEVLRLESSHRDRGIPDGDADRVDRIRALGNAVYPDCAEFIGRRLIEAHCNASL